MKHADLFDSVESKREVYAIMQRDYARDSRQGYWWGMASGLLLAASYFLDFGSNARFGLGLLGFAATMQTLNIFIDNSNRNWTLHIIDWMEHRDDRS